MTILLEYSNFAYIFFKEFIAILPKYIKVNTHAIDLKENKQPFNGFIYNLGSVKLKTLKT